jgi:predicted XRE-type DNA-binding protein
MAKFPSKKQLDEARKKLDSGPASRLLPKDASSVDKVKYKICEKFVIYKNTKNITQKALAEKIGIDEALMSKILHYNFDEFTVDRLLKFLNVLYPNVEIDLKVA